VRKLACNNADAEKKIENNNKKTSNVWPTKHGQLANNVWPTMPSQQYLANRPTMSGQQFLAN
jgi:hypothetical protein